MDDRRGQGEEPAEQGGLRRMGRGIAAGLGVAGRQAGRAVRGAADAAARLRPHDVDEEDDDADADVGVLDAPEVPDDPELSRLDALEEVEDAEGLAVDQITAVLAGLQARPDLPLAEPFSAGLVPLLQAWAELADPEGFLTDSRVQRVLGVLGDRFSITISPDGLTVRGLLRRRHTPWRHVRALEYIDRYTMLRDHVLERLVADAVRRVGLPIPGLSWLLRRIIGALEHLVPDEEMATLADAGGSALLRVDRRGFDLELGGALALVAFLSPVLSEVAATEAAARGITVEGYRAMSGPAA